MSTQINQLRQLIRESIQEYIREVETSGNIAAQEAKIRACEEAIALREKKINMEGIDETMHEMIDQSKLNELKKEVKELKKYSEKTKKALEKMKMKAEGKTTKKMEDEGMENEEVVDEVNIDEYTKDPAANPNLEEELTPEEAEELKKKAEHYDKEYSIAETKKKPSAGMTKKEKSALSKKAHAGKDIGKKGKGFEKVAKAGEKQYGSKEAGQKVAAAAMWKAAAKHESINPINENITMSTQFLHMQKLAGLITESEYKQKLNESNMNLQVGGGDKVEQIPVDFIKFEKNDGSDGGYNSTRKDGSYSVTILAKRSDGDALYGKKEFKINVYINKEGNKIEQDAWYPDFDQYTSQIKIKDYSPLLKYITQNLQSGK